MERNYYPVDSFYKNKFGKKVYKISLNTNLGCPNRDGTISTEGCIFCSPKGSGDFCSSSEYSIKDQIHESFALIKSKVKDGLILPYFQAFTNTYGSPEFLERIYNEALSFDNSVGIAVATRPDCLGDEILNVLKRVAEKYFLQIELGLQTVNEKSAVFINRGYSLDVFERNYFNLRKINSHIVVHLILGLPGENFDDYEKAVNYLLKLKVDGVKIQMLHLMRGTPLEKYHSENPIFFMGMEQYVSAVSKLIKIIDGKMVIHRLTGDAPRSTLIEPVWSSDKKRILNEINRMTRFS